MSFDVDKVRRDFPILLGEGARGAAGKSLVYLDNGATTQKPLAVIEAVRRFYAAGNSNIHRGVYRLSQEATGMYEGVREKVRAFIGAREAAEIIFVRGTTEGINLVAQSWGRKNLQAGDEVVVSELEHHSNIVPWQMICAERGAALKVIPINEAGELRLEAYWRLLGSGRVKMVAVNHVSNALGTVNPVREIVQLAHAAGALCLIDGAQWVAHGVTDVIELGADFYVFSGHKMMGPTGIGVLYGRREVLDAMPPWQGGGDMIKSVTFARTEYAELPSKFEAGTPDIAGVAGLGAAVDYLQALNLRETSAYEHGLLEYATGRMREVPGLRIIGTAAEKASVISFVVEGTAGGGGPMSSLDIGMGLDKEGICVRTGHHCCQPVMEHFGIGSTARASFAFYNTRGEVDRLVEALQGMVERSRNQEPRNKEAGRKNGDGDAGIVFAAASAESVQAAADRLAEEFAYLGDREAKNEYVMELGAGLPRNFEVLKQVTERVPGCMSQVYLVGRKAGGNGDGVFGFVADADAEIVRGLIAILERLYSGQKAAEVAGFDIEGFFGRIGLDQFITSQRRNGLAGMVAKIRELAGTSGAIGVGSEK